MKKSLIVSALLAFSAPAFAAEGAPAQVAAPSVDTVVAKIQSFYEKTQGFDTRFEQRFQQGGMPSRFGGASAAGRMRFRKPEGSTGPLMRWDYDDGRILLLVKDRSWTFDPDTRQATEYQVDGANLSAAVTFLWGKGRLSDEFTITPSSRSDLSGEGMALELTPKKPNQGFMKVYLVADPQSGAVRQSVVVQSNGSENRISFLDARLNAEVKAADFDPGKAFPEGTTRTRAAIPGQ